MDHHHCIDFSLSLRHRPTQPIIFYVENYSKVIKTCFCCSLISIYCSPSICYICSWNFVGLWLLVALDLSFFVFIFFFLCRFPRLLLLPFLSKLLDFLFPFFFGMQFLLDFWDSSFWFQLWVCFSLIYGVFLIFISHWFEFSFSLFLVMQVLLDFWLPGILLFDFSFGYVLV